MTVYRILDSDCGEFLSHFSVRCTTDTNPTKNKLAKLGDAIAISKSETMFESLTDRGRS